MNTFRDQVNSKTEIFLDTKYFIEEFNLTWSVANFSQIFGTVDAEFQIHGNSTRWNLSLFNKKCIYLCRLDYGGPVAVKLKYRLISCYKVFDGESNHTFLSKNKVQILSLDDYLMDGKERLIKFENDTFKFFCTIKIVGPALTKIVTSNNFLKPSFEKLSDDLKKLLSAREHSDMTFLIGTQKLPVHKAILCARSKVFERMFQTDMLESKNQFIELDDIDFEAFEDFITFLYTGEVKMVSLYKTMNLYYVADKYAVEDLREKCSSYMEFNLSVGEACTILKFAEMHGDQKLKNAVSFYMQMHAEEIKIQENWKELIKRHPKLALDVLK